jgi:hypothetical protein
VGQSIAHYLRTEAEIGSRARSREAAESQHSSRTQQGS